MRRAAVLGGRGGTSKGLAVQLDAVHVLEQAVEHGVGDGGVAQGFVPVSTGSWEVTMVERSPPRSSMTSSRSAAWSGPSGRSKKSSTTRTPTRAQVAMSRARRPSARAMVISSNSRGARR